MLVYLKWYISQTSSTTAVKFLHMSFKGNGYELSIGHQNNTNNFFHSKFKVNIYRYFLQILCIFYLKEKNTTMG